LEEIRIRISVGSGRLIIRLRRSREARRLKENQIALRAAFLEKENRILKRVSTPTKINKEDQCVGSGFGQIRIDLQHPDPESIRNKISVF